jgi:hypothetical protein
VRERKGILQFLKNCLDKLNYNVVISGNEHIIGIIKAFLSWVQGCLEFLDEHKFCSHEQRFTLLYIKDEKPKKEKVKQEKPTFETMADKVHSGKRGFKYWAKEYNRIALEIIKKKSVNDPVFALILDEYFKSGL